MTCTTFFGRTGITLGHFRLYFFARWLRHAFDTIFMIGAYIFSGFTWTIATMFDRARRAFFIRDVAL